MVRDEISGECFRADKLLEDAIDALLLANPGMPFSEQEQHKIIQVWRLHTSWCDVSTALTQDSYYQRSSIAAC
jgi:hypothetical protein